MAQANRNELVAVKQQIDTRVDQFQNALPAHIPVERFTRVVLTAIQGNPDLLNCNRQTLFTSAVKAAQDGLLPDGREGALVPYKGEVQWLPMVAGIRKKVRNSGEIATWDVQAVYEKDQFDFELGDNPFIRHKPALMARGKIVAVYSIATLKTGEKTRDVMSIEDVEKIRAKSRSAKGPWNDPTFYPEMAKKTVAKRHSKVLPMSTDLDDLMRRDDALYDMKGAGDENVAQRPRGLAGRLDALAGSTAAPATTLPAHDAETGEIIDHDDVPSNDDRDDARGNADVTVTSGKRQPADEDDGEPGSRLDPVDIAFQRGEAAHEKGMGRKTLPPEYRTEDRRKEADAWLAGWDNSAT